MKCVGVNDKECNAWVYDPNYPNDNVCASCARELEEGKTKTADPFAEGVRYALSYLQDLYEGVDETDLWSDFMTEEAND